MTLVVDSETGERLDVSPAEAQAGFLDGRFGLVGDRVNMIDADGHVFNVDAGETDAALQSGARLASDEEVAAEVRREEFGTGAQRVLAGAEAVARGATLGLSTPLEVALGADPERIRARQEASPESTALEVAGAVATTPLTGGAGALGLGARGVGLAARAGQAARVAGAVPRAAVGLGRATEASVQGALGARGATVAGRALAGTAAGAVEGGIAGVGQTISEASLGDIELTAEHVLANAARGAVFGGATSGILTGTATATGKAFKAAARKVFSAENVEKVVNRAAFRQFGPLQGHVRAAMRQFGDDPGDVIGRVARDEGITDLFGKSAEEIAEITTAKKEQWGKAVGDAVAQLDEAVDDTIKPSLQTIAKRLRSGVIAPLKNSSSRTSRRLGKRVEEELSSFDPVPDALPAKLPDARVQRRARGPKPATEAVDPLTNIPPPETGAGKLLTGVAGGAGHVARRARAKGELGPLLTGKAPRKLGFADLHRMRRELDAVAFPPRAPGAPAPHPNAFQAELQKARGIVEDELEKAADAAAEIAGDAINATYRQAKERFAVFKFLDGVARKNVERDVANRTISLTDTIAGAGGLTSSAIIGMFASDASVLGGLTIALVGGVAAGLVNKFIRDQGRKLAATVGNKLLTIKASSDLIEKRVQQAASSFFAPVRRAVPLGVATGALQLGDDKRSRKERFENRVAQLERSVVAEMDMLGMEDEAPQVADAIKQTMTRAQTFLASKTPIMPSLEGVKSSAEFVPPSEQSKFLRYARTADDFSTFIEDLASGSVTPEAIEAAQTVYPKAYGKLKTSLETQLGQEGSANLSPDRRVQLSLVLGRPVHFTLEPAFIASTQAAIVVGDEVSEGPVSPSRRSKPDISSAEITKTDAMESA